VVVAFGEMAGTDKTKKLLDLAWMLKRSFITFFNGWGTLAGRCGVVILSMK